MQDAKARLTFDGLSSNKTRNLILILAAAVVLVLLVNIDKITGTGRDGAMTTSQAELSELYGLRVNLVAVTAAGGFVDVRMMILDGEKAKSLLSDPENLPALSVGESTLQLSEQAREQDIRYEANGTLFFMFPNAGNTVRKGTPVTIRFGDVVLEPIYAQ